MYGSEAAAADDIQFAKKPPDFNDLQEFKEIK